MPIKPTFPPAQQAAAVRKKLAELAIAEQDIEEAIAWARQDDRQNLLPETPQSCAALKVLH
jgi:hypothetical protein